jgi:hypothetical protein
MAINKRHFPVGYSGRSPREAYRIDHTSVDGSGLCRDDGAQHKEGLPSDATGEDLHSRDTRSPNMRGSGY